MLGHRPFIDDVSGKGGEAYLAPGNDAAWSLRMEPLASRSRRLPASIRPLLSMLPAVALEVVLRAQGTGVPQVPAGDQVHVAPPISAPFGPTAPRPGPG